MRVTCLSDTHGFLPKLDGGDLLIVAGDLTESDKADQYSEFGDWVHSQPYKKKVVIAGNHDNLLYGGRWKLCTPCEYGWDFDYLQDSGIEFMGFRIWGSPWTKTFKGMNPNCKAFTRRTDRALAAKWALIPTETDILVTHAPPWTILDFTTDSRQVGSPSLMEEHLRRLRPKLWVFGHIHEAYGQDGPYKWNKTKYVNASHVNEHYKPVNAPVNIEI